MKFLANAITYLKALLLLEVLVFLSANKAKLNKNQFLNKKNYYNLKANLKEQLSVKSQTQSLSSLIIDEKEISVLNENSNLCDKPGYVCPFGFTCRKETNDPSSEYKCIKGFKYLKEPCSGEALGAECAEGLYCQYSEKLAKLSNNAIIRLKNFHFCVKEQDKIITLPHPNKSLIANYIESYQSNLNNNNNNSSNYININQSSINEHRENIENKNCNLMNRVCPIGSYCALNKDFEYACESGNKKENEQCLGEADYCSENLACSLVDDNFTNSIGKKIIAGNSVCKKVEAEASKIFAGFKYFLEECEKEGIYGKNTCMFGAYCDSNYEAGKNVCLRGKKKFKENCDAKIMPGDEIDCEKGLECKCVGHFFKSCKCEKSFRSKKNKVETKKFRVFKKLGR